MTDVAITGIAAGGDGVGRLPDGMTVFVPRTAPGDLVRITVTERHKRFARAAIEQMREAAPGRVSPGCPHYDADGCGGCQLQHLGIAEQRVARQRIVGEAVRRIGKRDVPDPDMVPAPDAWRYRSTITLHVAQGRIGYHRFDRPGHVFDLDDCHIARQPLMDLWRHVSAARDRLPPGTDTVRLREDVTGGRHVVVGGGAPGWDARALHAALPEGIAVWWAPADGAPRVLAGPETGYPALAFAQVHPALAGRVRLDAVDALGDIAGPVWDLYGGVGDTARLLGERGAAVTSVDADRSAIAWARRQPGAIDYIADRVEDTVARLPPPTAVVLNPPRAGAHALVTAALNARAVRTAYLSCDPATLARDLQQLLPAYRLASLELIDLFPQTFHIESLARLERA